MPDLDLTIIRADHWISGTGRIVDDEAGVPVRAAGVGMDVTERERLEAQPPPVAENGGRGPAGGGIAHDFNNLRTAIHGYAELLANSLPDADPRRADTEEIKRAAERAATLIRQLLAFSRKQTLVPQVLRLGDVVAAVAPMLRRLISESIDLQTIATGGGHVKADAGQIEQVLVNLTVNARDAMPNGGRLTIDTADVFLDEPFARQHASARPGPHVVLAVSDTGHGMDAVTQGAVRRDGLRSVGVHHRADCALARRFRRRVAAGTAGGGRRSGGSAKVIGAWPRRTRRSKT